MSCALAAAATAAGLTERIAGTTEQDRRRADATIQEALETTPSRQATFWSNVASGNAGVVTPVRTFRTSGGYFCRVYVEKLVSAASEEHRRTATACRDDGGVWRDLTE